MTHRLNHHAPAATKCAPPDRAGLAPPRLKYDVPLVLVLGRLARGRGGRPGSARHKPRGRGEVGPARPGTTGRSRLQVPLGAGHGAGGGGGVAAGRALRMALEQGALHVTLGLRRDGAAAAAAGCRSRRCCEGLSYRTGAGAGAGAGEGLAVHARRGAVHRALLLRARRVVQPLKYQSLGVAQSVALDQDGLRLGVAQRVDK
eukprot:scaffold33461_cov54-Phaeocystis_antarctica.AAC.2